MGTCRSDHLTEKTCHTTPLRRYPPPPPPNPHPLFWRRGRGGCMSHVAYAAECCMLHVTCARQQQGRAAPTPNMAHGRWAVGGGVFVPVAANSQQLTTNNQQTPAASRASGAKSQEPRANALPPPDSASAPPSSAVCVLLAACCALPSPQSGPGSGGGGGQQEAGGSGWGQGALGAGSSLLSSRRGQPLFCSAGICAARAKYHPA
jgi:hypothetical protein